MPTEQLQTKQELTRLKEAARVRKWRRDNLEHARELDRKRYAADPSKKIESLNRYRAENPGKRAPWERRTKLKRHGLTPQQYDALYEHQRKGCALCEKQENEDSRRLHVDHCHVSGQVRGLLCFACNAKLGKFEAGMLDGWDGALKYLADPPAPQIVKARSRFAA